MKRLILVLAILLFLPVLASPQSTGQITPEQAQTELDKRKLDKFLKAKSFKCNFENGYFASWENGKLKSKATSDTVSLIFDSVDHKKQTARMSGNQGAVDIFVNTTFGGINLIEITGAGSFITTTIYMPSAKDNIEDQFFAVHSRHIAPFLDLPMSSQYYGQCKIWDINR